MSSFFRSFILVSCLLAFSFGTAFAIPTTEDFNLRGDAKLGSTDREQKEYMDSFKGKFGSYFFGGDLTGEVGAEYLMITIARDLKNLFILIAVVYLFILVIKLFFSQGNEEDGKKWRLGILWTSIGIVVMQSAYSFVSTFFLNQKINGSTAMKFLDNIVYPFVRLLEMLASFAFLAMAFYAFFRIVVAGGGEEKIKKGKQTIIGALLGLFLLKIPKILVESVYGRAKEDCALGGLFCVVKVTDPNPSDTIKIMTTVVNYFNSFIGIITILLIIYAGFLVITGGGDDEKMKKAKSIVKYAIIGVFLIVASYALFNFFVLKG